MSALRKLWSNISRNGVKPEMSFVLQQRVILSNWISIALFLASFLFVVVFLIGGNTSILPLIITMIISLFIQFVNYLHLDKLSRWILSILPPLASMAITVTTKMRLGTDTELIHYVSPRLFILVTITIPLTLFTWKEWLYMLSALVLIVGLVLGYDYINTYFGIDYQQLNIQSRYYHIIYEDIFSIALTLLVLFIFLFRINDKYEKINKKLLEETQQQNQELKENEDKLKQSLEKLQLAQKQEENQVWISKELNTFNQILHGQDNFQQIAPNVVSFLAHSLNALQINLYLLTEDKTKLFLCDTFAPEYLETQKEFYVGEGLIGEVAKSGEVLHLEDIAHQNKQVKTATKSLIINNLIIIPLLQGKQVEGILEIGFTHKIPLHHIIFLEDMSENLAISIHHFYLEKYNQKLLQKTKETAEKLKKQEKQYRKKIGELELQLKNIRNNEEFIS